MLYRPIAIAILLLAGMHSALAAARALTAVFDQYNAAVKLAKADKLSRAQAALARAANSVGSSNCLSFLPTRRARLRST